MLHPPGDRLGPYEIVGSLGAGGMGEVYEARDTRLERTVAVKVSKETFEDRFRNEALSIAALNHPHICALFDVGPDYLVMEFVPGKRLEGPLPVGEALRLAGQIADALEHAHTHGIVHRDLKPSNIFVTKAGVKVLDFGVAKRLSSAVGKGGEHTATDNVVLLGTPRYMAPEQIEGKDADERTDIFAFGLVLYEMLTGRHAFEGTSAAKVMAAILEKDPAPASTLNPAIPPALAQVVATCLAKDPAERWQSVRELRHALAWASSPIPAPRRGWRRLGLIAAALALPGLAGFALLRRSARPARPQAIQLQVALPPRGRLDMMSTVAVSPDGQRIAFSVTLPEMPPQIFMRRLDGLTATPVGGAERATDPFWSPDSRQIGFWAINGNGLKKVDPSGGPAQIVCRSCASGDGGSTWGRGDVIVFSTLGRLSRVSAQGGEPEPLGALVPGETGRFWPQFLPDSRHYLYLSLASRKEDQGIYVGALDSNLRKRIVAAEHTAAYSPPGYLLFIKEGVLVAQPFDADRLEVSGEPVTVLDEDVARFAGTTTAGRAHFSVSTNGVLGWRPGPIGDVRQLTWFDRSGRKTGTVGEPGVYFGPSLSPDEKTVAVCRYESSSNREIWLLDVSSGASRRLTFDPHDDCGPIWSPDGAWIAFFSDRRGVRELYRKRADGSGEDELLLASKDFPLHVEDWSADGRFLAYNSPRPGHDHDLFLLPLASPGEASPIPFLATPAMETAGRIAPSGRWIAYMSNETGVMQVYVRELSPHGNPGPGKWQISHDRGYTPRWRADGKELFFFERSTPMAVDVKTDGPRFEAGVPRPLGITLGDDVGPFLNHYCVRRDGQRLLLSVPVKQAEPVRVLVNWLPEEAARR
jgi:Tol biopolymer transport system component